MSNGTGGSSLPEEFRGGAISIGNFDGVHRGHAALLSRVRRMADRVGGPAIAVTFDPHPVKLLRPELAPTRLTSIAVRAERMSQIGMDALVVCETTPDLLNLSAAEFFQSLVCDQLDAKGIVEGPNFFFGKDRGGDVEVLRKMAQQSKREIEIVNPELDGDRMVSSSMIRSCIASGDVAEAALLCGHRHLITGIVSKGAQRGRKIGFPTANLENIDALVPKPGVYAGLAWLPGENDYRYAAAIHIGPNPTFDDDGAVKVEVHLIDYDGGLYDQHLRVEFVDRLRDIQRFDSSDDLKMQLEKDVQSVRDLNLPKGKRR
ncbi:bifunctional riboflavin kinase/FAD synthetase [Rubripirellula obstinata]|uniref:bifunctional riboflavin kinase/FAD synthetase n=1 Tax=Rubripirellula obstinata TaxID=406547 RepID=UPI001F00697F|nr:bifunctional riboflavin kinase/FAD synthetase [Rubripirellula obstinata]